MNQVAPFHPSRVFAQPDMTLPRVMVSPARYIQGPGVLAKTGSYVALMDAKCYGILASTRSQQGETSQVIDSLKSSGYETVTATFGGECSLEEIDQQVANLSSQGVDALVAVGGGKCVDAGKCIAQRLGVPIVVIPSLASNDAPTSAVAVLYSTEGVFTGAEFFPQNPALVIVDTEIIADSSPRYLAAGIGDAMATWYEARVCINNPNGRSTVGARPTLAATAISEICARTLMSEGAEALDAVRKSEITPALENVVEANTLLSGIGFESGGLAIAHAVANNLTMIPRVHDNYLHGEMVALGTMIQLAMEDQKEADEVGRFFAEVGLPMCLSQVSLAADDAEIDPLLDQVLRNPSVLNMPFEVTREGLTKAFSDMDELGNAIVSELGDAPYQALHQS
ncbi:MAG: glycerol dehydrogenase [Gammaproteobacteria bacterium]|uniref:Glycerol dehydrogenase n=1 Tax=OM182 bacterium MED-G24 TaxID=1986255 RepID=A0A2A5WLI7_9GAMM|nr:glycerol dehydrogenase [Gammaproteobacteria bacterium]PDH37390.1 MAG: glycerol dehydrogenase [OM182 bacterium MED-G24]RPG23346.1 MAG: glycerol dehydrogenase [Gammaproteobacteria bacterium TMED50]|tara:strand:- start:4114 stop:5301 length:1188 start_codon:yes stop_codon:yes gene_type:complete